MTNVIKGLQRILRIHLPEIREKVNFIKIIPELNFLSEKERQVIVNAESNDNVGLNTLIGVILKSNDIKYFIGFVRALHRFQDSSDTAVKIITDAKEVHATIEDEVLYPPALSKQQKRSGDTANVIASSNFSSRKETIIQPHNQLDKRHLTIRTLEERRGNHIHGGTELDSLSNELFTKFIEELNQDNKWEHLGNKMNLSRREMRKFEQTANPAKGLLDYISNLTISKVFHYLNQAGLTEIQHKLQINIIEEKQGIKLSSLENEYHLFLTTELNKENNWIKLANKMGLKRKQVKKLEGESDPAKALLDEHLHLTTEELKNFLDKAGLNHIFRPNDSADDLTKNDLDAVMNRPVVPISSVNIEESITNNTDTDESSQILPRSSSSSEKSETSSAISSSENDSVKLQLSTKIVTSSTRRYADDNTSNSQCSVRQALSITSTRRDGNNDSDTFPKDVESNSCESYQACQVESAITTEKAIITCPENEHGNSEKNAEHTREALARDRRAQHSFDEYRDIRNSLPSCENNYLVQNAQFSCATRNALCDTNPSSQTSAGDKQIIGIPVDDQINTEKNPEQTCAALLQDANEQIGIYRDIQNSLPDLLSSDEETIGS